MLVLGLCLFFTRLVGHRFGRRSSCRRSLIRCCRRSSVVLPLVVAVGRCRWSSCRPSSGRLSVVGRRSLSSSVSRWSSVVLSVVRRPFPFPVLRLPNCRGTLSPTAFHHGRPVCLLPPSGLLTVSQLSSSRLQLTLPTTVWGVSPAPPFGFRLLASASGSASLVHFPFSSSRLPSPPWPSPGFSRSPGSVLSSSPRRSRQTSLGPVPRHSLRSLGLPRGFPSLRVPLLGFVSALPSGSLLGPFWVPSGIVFLGLPPTLLRSASSPLPSPGSS